MHFSQLLHSQSLATLIDPFPHFESCLNTLQKAHDFSTPRASRALQQLTKACSINSPGRLQPFDAYTIMRMSFHHQDLTRQVALAMITGFSMQSTDRYGAWMDRLRYHTVTGQPLVDTEFDLAQAMLQAEPLFWAQQEREALSLATLFPIPHLVTESSDSKRL